MANHEDEQKTREALEIERLRLEVYRLEHPTRTSFREIDWKDVNSVLVAVLGIAVAWYAGVFEVRQQRLAAQTDKLAVERGNLEQSNADLMKTKAGLENEAHGLEIKVRALQDQVGTYERERTAIKAISELGKGDLWVRIALTSDVDSFEVSIEPLKIHWDTMGKPNERIDYYPAIRRLLDEMRSVPRLRVLRLACIEVTNIEMKAIGDLQQLESLTIDHAKLTDEVLEPLANLPKLKVLGIEDKGICNPRPLRKLPAVNVMVLSGTSLDDNGLSTLASIRSLSKLWADRTQITDAGIEHINAFNKLVLIGLRKTKITPSGCLKIRLPSLILQRYLRECLQC